MEQLRARIGRWLGRGGDGPWRTRNDPVRGRRRALKEEVAYWRDWVAERGGRWKDEYEYRFDPASEVADPALRGVIANLPQEEVSVLDVGSGPASMVGYTFPGKTVALVAVDPLADEYGRILGEAGVVPPVRATRAEGERLLDQLGPARFDIAYARNALDHAVDPPLIIENMLGVVRPGGYVVLRHVRNEAVRQAYVQLHQWNLDRRDEHLVAWRPGREIDLGAGLAGRAEIHCYLESAEGDEGPEWIVCIIRRLA
jgi:SAM-dependent methyltransferase